MKKGHGTRSELRKVRPSRSTVKGAVATAATNGPWADRWRVDETRNAKRLNKKAMAERMHTGRSHIDRIVVASDTGLALEALSRAACVVGRRVRVELTV